MRVWPLRSVFVLLLVTVCAWQKLDAQTTTSGALAGVITDQSGAVIPGADVEIRDNVKGTTQSTKTDREGMYQFFFLAPARYTLTVTHSGFREEKRTVNVLLGPAVSVNVTLAIAEARSEIIVADEVPLIQAENGDPSATMSQRQISETPNPGNDLTYVVQTAPGVVMNTDLSNDSRFSILGMPGFSYLFTTDGISNNGPFNEKLLRTRTSLGRETGMSHAEVSRIMDTLREKNLVASKEMQKENGAKMRRWYITTTGRDIVEAHLAIKAAPGQE